MVYFRQFVFYFCKSVAESRHIRHVSVADVDEFLYFCRQFATATVLLNYRLINFVQLIAAADGLVKFFKVVLHEVVSFHEFAQMSLHGRQ